MRHLALASLLLTLPFAAACSAEPAEDTADDHGAMQMIRFENGHYVSEDRRASLFVEMLGSSVSFDVAVNGNDDGWRFAWISGRSYDSDRATLENRKTGSKVTIERRSAFAIHVKGTLVSEGGFGVPLDQIFRFRRNAFVGVSEPSAEREGYQRITVESSDDQGLVVILNEAIGGLESHRGRVGWRSATSTKPLNLGEGCAPVIEIAPSPKLSAALVYDNPPPPHCPR